MPTGSVLRFLIYHFKKQKVQDLRRSSSSSFFPPPLIRSLIGGCLVCIVYEQRPGGAPGEDGGGISIDAIVSYHRRAAASRGFGFGVFLRVRCSLILFLSSIQSFRLGSVRAAEGGGTPFGRPFFFARQIDHH